MKKNTKDQRFDENSSENVFQFIFRLSNENEKMSVRMTNKQADNNVKQMLTIFSYEKCQILSFFYQSFDVF